MDREKIKKELSSKLKNYINFLESKISCCYHDSLNLDYLLNIGSIYRDAWR